MAEPTSPAKDKNYNLIAVLQASLQYVWQMETYIASECSARVRSRRATASDRHPTTSADTQPEVSVKRGQGHEALAPRGSSRTWQHRPDD
jgi:hypothetical protein